MNFLQASWPGSIILHTAWLALGLLIPIVIECCLIGSMPLRECMANCFMPVLFIAEFASIVSYITHEDTPDSR